MERQDLQEPLALQAKQVKLAQMVQQAPQDLQEGKVHVDQQDPLDPLVLLVIQVHLAQVVKQDLQVQKDL